MDRKYLQQMVTDESEYLGPGYEFPFDGPRCSYPDGEGILIAGGFYYEGFSIGHWPSYTFPWKRKYGISVLREL